MCRGITVQGATSLLGGLALLLTPLPLLLYLHGGALRDRVRERKEAAAAAQAAAQSTATDATTSKAGEQELERIPAGGAVEGEVLRSSADASSSPPRDIA